MFKAHSSRCFAVHYGCFEVRGCCDYFAIAGTGAGNMAALASRIPEPMFISRSRCGTEEPAAASKNLRPSWGRPSFFTQSLPAAIWAITDWRSAGQTGISFLYSAKTTSKVYLGYALRH